MRRASSAIAALGSPIRSPSRAQSELCPIPGCGSALHMDTDGGGRVIAECPRHGVVGWHRPQLVAGEPLRAPEPPLAPLPYDVDGCCPHCGKQRRRLPESPKCKDCGGPREKGKRVCDGCRVARLERSRASTARKLSKRRRHACSAGCGAQLKGRARLCESCRVERKAPAERPCEGGCGATVLGKARLCATCREGAIRKKRRRPIVAPPRCACGQPRPRGGTFGRYAAKCATCDPDGAAHLARRRARSRAREAATHV